MVRGLLPLIVGSALTAAALAWLWGDAEREGLDTARPTMLDFGRPPVPPVLRQPLATDAPAPTGAAAAVAAPAAAAPPPAEPVPLVPPAAFEALFSRVTVLAADRFRAIRDRQPLVIRLAGISGAAFSDTCAGVAGRWNCGARARADLARLIGPRSVGCVDLRVSEDDGESRADCWVGPRNLSVFMVSRGWAEPIDPADKRLAPYAAKARADRLGRYGDGSLAGTAGDGE